MTFRKRSTLNRREAPSIPSLCPLNAPAPIPAVWHGERHTENDDPFEGIALALAGRTEDATGMLVDLHRRYGSNQIWSAHIDLMQAFTRGTTGAIVEAAEMCLRLLFGDPEGLFYICVVLARSHEPSRALAVLRRTVDAGFSCPAGLVGEPSFIALNGNPESEAMRVEAERRHQRAAEAFDFAGVTRY